MAKQILLENINVPGIETLSVYRSLGGYQALEKALKMQPGEVVEEVKKSGLRGRGGAGYLFPLDYALMCFLSQCEMCSFALFLYSSSI